MADHAEEQYEDDGFEELEVKQAGQYSKAIVFLCLLTIVAFTVTCFVYLWNGKPLNDTLTVLFFGCFGLEFASLAFIKGRKIRYVEGNPANKQMSHVEVQEEEENEDEHPA
jgi:hypothetical protein